MRNKSKNNFFTMCLKCLDLLDLKDTEDCIDGLTLFGKYEDRLSWVKVQNKEISNVCEAYGYGSNYLKIVPIEKIGGWGTAREFCNFGKRQLFAKDRPSGCSGYIKLMEVKSEKVVACKLEVLDDYSSYIAWVRDCGWGTGVMVDLIKIGEFRTRH